MPKKGYYICCVLKTPKPFIDNQYIHKLDHINYLINTCIIASQQSLYNSAR